MSNDHPNEIRLQIPMAIGPQRYGTLPAGMVDAASATQATRLSITTKIQTSGVIRPEDVTSPSHGSAVRVSAYRTHRQEKSERRMVARFRSVEAAASELEDNAEELDEREAPESRRAKLTAAGSGWTPSNFTALTSGTPASKAFTLRRIERMHVASLNRAEKASATATSTCSHTTLRQNGRSSSRVIAVVTASATPWVRTRRLDSTCCNCATVAA